MPSKNRMMPALIHVNLGIPTFTSVVHAYICILRTCRKNGEKLGSFPVWKVGGRGRGNFVYGKVQYLVKLKKFFFPSLSLPPSQKKHTEISHRTYHLTLIHKKFNCKLKCKTGHAHQILPSCIVRNNLEKVMALLQSGYGTDFSVRRYGHYTYLQANTLLLNEGSKQFHFTLQQCTYVLNSAYMQTIPNLQIFYKEY